VEYVEPPIAHLPRELTASVTANVTRILVSGAPETRMLRHGDEQAAAGTKSSVHRCERTLVAVYVFEDVERPHDVELLSEGQIQRIELQ
jgi:hypothetical protein